MNKTLNTFLLMVLSSVSVTSFSQVISGGGQHSLSVCPDGSVMTWGSNYSGQLGDGKTGARNYPAAVTLLNKVNGISSGWENSLALMNDSTVWSWGYNGFGQLGNGDTINKRSPVHVQNLTSVTAIGWGHLHTHNLAAKADGTAWTWGRNADGQLGDDTFVNRSIPVQVHGPGNVGFLSGIIALSGGHDYSLALKNDGTAWAWGANDFGQLGDSSTTSSSSPVQVHNITGLKAVVVGDWTSFALKDDSTVWAWGYNGSGRLGDSTVASRSVPVQVLGPGGAGFLNNIIAIASGEAHALALKADGTVWTWGKNDKGQLGDNSTSNRWVPVQVVGPGGSGYLTDVVAIAGGAAHSLAKKRDGTMWAWGDNSAGQLGDGTNSASNTPVQVTGLCNTLSQVDNSVVESDLEIRINPLTGSITVESANPHQPMDLAVFNIIGENVYRGELSNGTKSVELSSQPSGLYLLCIQTEEKIVMRKIVRY